MQQNEQTTELLYQSWNNLKAAVDDLDRSKRRLEKAELEMETVMYLLENNDDERKSV